MCHKCATLYNRIPEALRPKLPKALIELLERSANLPDWAPGEPGPVSLNEATIAMLTRETTSTNAGLHLISLAVPNQPMHGGIAGLRGVYQLSKALIDAGFGPGVEVPADDGAAGAGTAWMPGTAFTFATHTNLTIRIDRATKATRPTLEVIEAHAGKATVATVTGGKALQRLSLYLIANGFDPRSMPEPPDADAHQTEVAAVAQAIRATVTPP